MAETYKKSSTRDTFESLVVTVILAVFGTTFVLQAFKIPTGSMETTLLIGDHLLVNKFAFADQPGWVRRILPYRGLHRGDELVFKFPGVEVDQGEPGEHFVKRVIGVPGDRIRIQNRQVFVNGVASQEPYLHHAAGGMNTPCSPERFASMSCPGDSFPPAVSEYLSGSTAAWTEDLQNYVKNGELLVPSDSYFVMGDNREQSWDSRFWGFVPRSLISGRPVLVYWSYETPRGEYTQNSIGDKISQLFDLIIHFPTKTRWQRTLKIVR